MPFNSLIILFLLFFGVPITPWCLYKTHPHTDTLYEASYSPNGKVIVLASKDGNNYALESISLNPVNTYSAGVVTYSAKFSPDGNYIAYGLTNNSIIIHDSSYNHVTTIGSGLIEIN